MSNGITNKYYLKQSVYFYYQQIKNIYTVQNLNIRETKSIIITRMYKLMCT